MHARTRARTHSHIHPSVCMCPLLEVAYLCTALLVDAYLCTALLVGRKRHGVLHIPPRRRVLVAAPTLHLRPPFLLRPLLLLLPAQLCWLVAAGDLGQNVCIHRYG